MNSQQTYTLAAVLLFCSLVSAGAVAQESEGFDAEAKYQTTCFACHGTGQAHAPVVGDIIEWEIRLEKGFDTLVQSTINGLNGMMPARGLCSDCTDGDLKAIVQFMIDESQ
jgi:cytochrome c5